MTIDPKLLDELLVDYKRPERHDRRERTAKAANQGSFGVRWNAERPEHPLATNKHDPAGYNSGNSRNGATKKR